jgi:cell division protein FtsZ
VNEAAAIIHDVAHPDANIIFGNVIDDALGDTVRVTVIAAGFDRFDAAEEPRKPSVSTSRTTPDLPSPRPSSRPQGGAPGERDLTGPVLDRGAQRGRDVFDVGDDDLDLDDDFDVPSFLR